MGPSDFSVSLVPLGTDSASEHNETSLVFVGPGPGGFGTKVLGFDNCSR